MMDSVFGPTVQCVLIQMPVTERLFSLLLVAYLASALVGRLELLLTAAKLLAPGIRRRYAERLVDWSYHRQLVWKREESGISDLEKGARWQHPIPPDTAQITTSSSINWKRNMTATSPPICIFVALR
ncbi:unnamed protein product, partial [Mesorhabditis spiculigera]